MDSLPLRCAPAGNDTTLVIPGLVPGIHALRRCHVSAPDGHERVGGTTLRFATCIGMNPDLEDLKDKALAIHRRLCEVYECPIPYFHNLDPVSELVSSLLSHRTRNADSGRAFKALKARYPDWRAMTEAPTERWRRRSRA